MYHKPTDSFNSITFNSGHPRHTKVNIPFNMARQIRTIVSDKERSKQELQDLKTSAERKNYPKRLIEDGIKRAKNILQEELRKTKAPQENNKITLHNVRSVHREDTTSTLRDIMSTSGDAMSTSG